MELPIQYSYFLIFDLPSMMRPVKPSGIIPVERIEKAGYLIRGEKLMLDRDLAELYEVETRVLNQAVGRHRDRFPTDLCLS
jgi:hypothetical protein